jgi:hypothetical protein
VLLPLTCGISYFLFSTISSIKKNWKYDKLRVIKLALTDVVCSISIIILVGLAIFISKTLAN